jgi:dihydrodipicolinate synthase/N-acetylneuraminate lyase
MFQERTEAMNGSGTASRTEYLHRIFPNGVPRLWCPPLTHYDQQGAIDRARIIAHLRHLSPHVGGFLIPGSTGDGWELSREERRQVLALGLEQAKLLNRHVLIGALHPDTGEALKLIKEDVVWLKAESGRSDTAGVLAQAHVCGFTVCPPRGKELSQADIGHALSSVLELGLPTAIYQLPQVTENEMSWQLAVDLAQRHQNFVFFKDTSGLDAVVLSGQSLAGVFTARGAEGDYAGWLKAAGGHYEGFLLASANCFAKQLGEIILAVSTGQRREARDLSDRLATVVRELLREATVLPHGNAFANANKAMDHFFAHGPSALRIAPPRLHGGQCLPQEFIRRTQEVLSAHGLMPGAGYLG